MLQVNQMLESQWDQGLECLYWISGNVKMKINGKLHQCDFFENMDLTSVS